MTTPIRELSVSEKVVIKFDPAPGVSGATIEISRIEAEGLLEGLAEALGVDS